MYFKLSDGHIGYPPGIFSLLLPSFCHASFSLSQENEVLVGLNVRKEIISISELSDNRIYGAFNLIESGEKY